MNEIRTSRTREVLAVLAAVIVLASNSEALGQANSLITSNTQDGIRVNTEWFPANAPRGGYNPIYVELTSTRGPRELRVVIQNRAYPVGCEVSQTVKLEANSPVRFPLAVPLTSNIANGELRVYERGTELDKLRQSGVGGSSWWRGESPGVLLVSRAAPDWRLFEQATTNFLVGIGGTEHTQLLPAKMPTRWIDYSMLDLVLTPLAELEQMPADGRDALVAWTLTGGNLVVFGVATDSDRASLERLLDVERRPPAGAAWRLPNLEERRVAAPGTASSGTQSASSTSWPAESLARLDRQGLEAYRNYCTTLLNSNARTARSAADQNNLAWACVLGPDAVPDLSAVVALAERACAGTPANAAYLNTLGVALYRAGRFQDSIQKLGESMNAQGRGGIPEDWFFLAMAHRRLGNADEANKWLEKGVLALERPDAKNEWKLFRREADALISGVTQTEAPSEAKPTKADGPPGAATAPASANADQVIAQKNGDAKTVSEADAPFAVRAFGMGQLVRMSSADPFPGTEEDWTWLFRTLGSGRLKWSERHGMTAREGNPDFWNFLIEGVGRAPVNAFQVAIVIFTLVIGPLNYFVLRRRKQLYYLIVTVPSLALLTTGLLLGYAAGSEGFATRTRVRSVTLLDQSRGESVSWSRASYYAGLAPQGGLHFSPDTAVYPILPDDATPPYRTVDWTEDQRLGGWLQSRTPTQFLLVSYRQAGEQLVIASDEHGSMRATNNLGAAIRRVVVADGEGNLFTGENVARSARVKLEPIDATNAAKHLSDLVHGQRMEPPDEIKGGVPAPSLFPLFSYAQPSRSLTAVSAKSLLEDALRRLVSPQESPTPHVGPLSVSRTFVAIVDQPTLIELGVKDNVDADSLYVIWGKY